MVGASVYACRVGWIWRGMQEECFYYSETRSIKIESFFMVFINCGYKVTIETRFKTSVFYYAFGGPHDKTQPKDIPFALLAERIPQRSEKSDDVSVIEYHQY